MKQTYTALEAALQNCLRLHLDSLNFMVGNTLCSLRYLGEYPSFEPKFSLKLDIVQQPVLIECFDTTFLSLHPETKDLQDIDCLPKELKQALAQFLFETPLQQFSQITNMPMSFLRESQEIPMEKALTYAFMFSFDNKEIPLIIRITEDCAHMFIQKLKSLPSKKTDLSHIPMSCATIVGSMEISLKDLQGLELGDVLIPDTLNHLSHERSALFQVVGVDIYNDLPSFICQLNGNELQLLQPYSLKQEINMSQEQEFASEQAPTGAPHEASEPKTPKFDEIKVKLSFELERRMMTLGELQDLQVGTNILLDVDTLSPVTLCVSDTPFAKARIVEIDGKHAVQLTELLLKKD